MPVTIEAVHEALSQTGFARVEAMKLLRSQGTKFRTATFIELANEIEADLDRTIAEAEEDAPLVDGVVEAPDAYRPRTDANMLVFTCAQNNTRLHGAFFESLLAYCGYHNAELHISRFTYNKGTYRKSVKPGSRKSTDGDEFWWDPAIYPYISDQSLQIADDLVWCGELNILPTRQNPLSSFQSYTRQNSGIIPHAKMAMQSMPTMKFDPARFLYTTGTVTQRNYIQKSTGQVAEFHHVFGALVVQVDPDTGEWYAWQLNADNDGGFYDRDQYWTGEGPTDARPAGIVHGDLHWTKRDEAILEAVFDTGGILDQLRPELQFFHDTVDFTARNHHNIKSPHFLHQMRMTHSEAVATEFKGAAEFLAGRGWREWCKTVVIKSNHDEAMRRWLEDASGASDPVNVEFWHRANAYVYGCQRSRMKPDPFWWALNQFAPVDEVATLVDEDDSFVLCGIQMGLHGHLGPNGARGNSKNLRTVGKACKAHDHTASITDGIYSTGVYGKLDMTYNKGLSSWSHSFTLVYPNGKRANFTIKNGKAWV